MNIFKILLITSISLFATLNNFATTVKDTNEQLEWCKQYEAKAQITDGIICESGITSEEKLEELIGYLSVEALNDIKDEVNVYFDQKLLDKIALSNERLKKYQTIK